MYIGITPQTLPYETSSLWHTLSESEMHDRQMLNALQFLDECWHGFQAWDNWGLNTIHRTNVVKGSVDAVTTALLQCPHTNTCTENKFNVTKKKKLSILKTIQNNQRLSTLLWIFWEQVNHWITTNVSWECSVIIFVHRAERAISPIISPFTCVPWKTCFILIPEGNKAGMVFDSWGWGKRSPSSF